MSTPHSEVIPPRRNSRPQLLAGHELSKYAVEERGGISRYANPDRVKNMDPQNRKNRALMRHSPPRIRPRRLDRRTPSLLPLRRFHRIPPETATRPAPEEQSQTATMGRPDHHRYAPTHHLHPVLQCSPTHETATHQPHA